MQSMLGTSFKGSQPTAVELNNWWISYNSTIVLMKKRSLMDPPGSFKTCSGQFPLLSTTRKARAFYCRTAREPPGGHFHQAVWAEALDPAAPVLQR